MAGIGRGGIALFLVAFGLTACGGGAPPNDVAQGVGFQDRQAWLERQAALRGETHRPSVTTVVPPTAPDTARVTAAPASPPAVAEPAARAVAPPDITQVAAAAITAADSAPAPVAPTSAPAVANPGISDEQDFDAVATRETIESDAERRARMQAERVVIRPTAVPDRPDGLGPNIIDFALSTSHPVGDRQYLRRPISDARHRRNCQAFRAADLAQEWFLQNGGPSRDRRGLDPDGDGFACRWDPSVYRAAAAAARN